jgi:hypothetical protein
MSLDLSKYKVTYAYYPDKSDMPLISQCTFYDTEGNIVSCGVSFCDIGKTPNNKLARELAFYRASTYIETGVKYVLNCETVSTTLERVGMLVFSKPLRKHVLIVPPYWENFIDMQPAKEWHTLH